MKNTLNLKTILIVFASFFCITSYSQLSINDEDYGMEDGAYYKDISNQLNKYVGTWKFTSGNTSLEIKFVKRVHHYDAGENIYYDYLAGEYIYIENGVEKANTMANLDTPNLDRFENALSGNFLINKYFSWGCPECAENEKRLQMVYRSPDRTYLDQKFVVRYYEEYITEKFLKIAHFGSFAVVPETGPRLPIIPEGVYILEKISD